MDLSSEDPRLLELADRLWHRETGAARTRAPIRLKLRVGPRKHDALLAPRQHLIESWTVARDGAVLRLGGQLDVKADIGAATIEGRVSAALLDRDPGLVARLLLEVPVAILLQRRSYAAIHAAAIAGPQGAVVLRGAPGAGKSTLVAAAWLAGLEVLGDESVLVAREDSDELLAAVRDPTLEPETVRLLGIVDGLTPATERAGPKQRMNLFSSADPARRSQRRVATVILGPRTEVPARLDAIDAETFLREFRAGEIREERWGGHGLNIEQKWSHSGAWRLSGAGDLGGAVKLLSELVGHVPHGGSRT